MKRILIITPFSKLKKRLNQIIKRRYITIDYLNNIDLEKFNYISKDDKLIYLNKIIAKSKADLLIWLPANGSKTNFLTRDLLSYCLEYTNIRCVVFDIKHFISIEKDKVLVLKNEKSRDDDLLKEKCNNILNIQYLMDSDISNSYSEVSLKSQISDYDIQISVSLIDDIAEYIFCDESNIEVPFQSYTLRQIDQFLDKGFISILSERKANGVLEKHDRLEIFMRQNACCLQPVYKLKARERWGGKEISSIRIEMGVKLSKYLSSSSVNELDIVVPVPETAKYYAKGLARALGKPYVEAIIANKSMGRSLQIENPDQRNIFIRKKLTVLEELVKNKNVGIVDEAVFTGATLRVVVDKLKDAGAKRIHILLPTPPNLRACEYNVLPKRNVLLDYVRRDDLKDYFDVDDVTFSSIDDLTESIGSEVCVACFDHHS